MMLRTLTKWMIGLALSALLMGVALAGAARAQTGGAQTGGAQTGGGAQTAAGDWHGVLTLPTGELRLGLEITAKPDGGFSGKLSSPDQGPGEFPLDEVKVDGGHMTFALKRLSASFDGRWDPAKSAWVGVFTQGAGLPLTLTAGKPAPSPVVAGLDGDWASTIALPGASTQRLVLHVRTTAGGTIASMDLPDQLAYGVVVRPITHDGQKVTWAMKASNATFEGVLSADGKTISKEPGPARPTRVRSPSPRAPSRPPRAGRRRRSRRSPIAPRRWRSTAPRA